jgi:hypothetical protein
MATSLKTFPTKGVHAGAVLLALIVPAFAQNFTGFQPANLVVSRSVYQGTASTVTVGQQLPPNCNLTMAAPGSCVTAIANGTYPGVFANDTVDGSFGVTSPIFLDQMTTGGSVINTLVIDPTQLVTSFSSKSELGLNLSPDGTAITFMGYASTPNQIDVSNSNTPGAVDTTNPVYAQVYRVLAEVNAAGNLQITDTNAYGGNNGRNAIKANGVYYTVGNSGNGTGSTVPDAIVAAAGVQFVVPGANPSTTPKQVGSFSVTQINPLTGKPYSPTPDKAGKDNNFRGITIFNNTLYITKGSGGNGINTLYQVGAAGSLPALANAGNAYIDVVPGFNTVLAKSSSNNSFPFGVWFANANTLYLGDEGDGKAADAATSTTAGLQKWVLGANGIWQLAYVLQRGLNLGQQYSVPGLPSSLNPAPDGLRNITGRLNADGTATIWGITSTVSASGDQGADPNQLVEITDVVANTNPAAAANEQFALVRTANYGEVLRGVSFTPGTTFPAPVSLPVTSSGFVYNRSTKTYTQTITLLNNTNQPYAGPAVVVLTNLVNGTVVGNPQMINGSPAIPILASGATLAPGQSASAMVSFTNPSNGLISYTPVVEP